MIVLDETLTLSPSDTAKHIAIPFSLPADGTELRIRYRYTPKRYEGEDAVDQVVACYGRYGLDCTKEEARKELPLNNLITLSLDGPHGWIGTAHRHLNDAVYCISQTPDPGFMPYRPRKGDYRAVVSTHAVLSDCVTVRIEGELIL